MRRLNERYEGMTADEPAAGATYNPPPPNIVLGSATALQAGPSMQSASMSLSVSLMSNAGRQRDTLSMGNTLTVSKLPAGQAARSFESALGSEPMRTSDTVESLKQCFGQSAHSFESTLPRFGSYEQHSLQGPFPSIFSESMAPQKLEDPGSNILEVPIQNLERRRHSFGPGNEAKNLKQEYENVHHSVLNINHSNGTGDEPRRVLRKQSAIDMEEMELGSGKQSPKSYVESKQLEKEEKRVMSHYNIDAYSFTKETSREEHVTVIRSPQTSVRQTVMRSQYQEVQESTRASRGQPLPSEASCKPTLNVISNEGAISSKYNRSQYLEPTSSFRTQIGFSSGSDDSPGPSSREHSPYRRESSRATSPYGKERVYAAPTPVIKTQVKKEVPDLSYELQSSTGSEGATTAAVFPEVTNIVITSETGESMRCKSEEDIPDVLSDSDHRRNLHPGNFKKHLHARYLSSLRSRHSSSSTDTSQEHLSQEYSDSLSRSGDVFDSTEADNIKDMLKPIAITHEGSSETSDDSTSDIQMGGESVIKSLPRSHIPDSRQDHQPLDLSSSLPPEAQPAGGQSYIGLSAYSEPDLLSPSLTKQNSPSLFHRSPHLQPQFVQSSQSSPLCSVPEGGRIFHFNFPSPYEGTCAHSDPEFSSPSPMSPSGLHFTFPPRPSMISSMSELNRLAVSPRAYYPNQPLQLSPLVKKSPRYRDSSSSIDRQYFSGDSDAYLCPVCTQLFPSYDNLAKHMAKHLPTETVRTADNNKIHYCKVCNRSFSRSDMLTRHMRLHTGLKPYECGECGQVFSRSDHLATHRRTHTGEKPYRCPSCPYAACRRDMITRHMRTHNKRSAKRGKYLSVPDRENSEVRKSSVSSTETTSSQEFSSRTFSASSGDSLDLDTTSTSGVGSYAPFTSRTLSLPSMDGSEMEFSPTKPRHWSTTSADSAVFEDQSQTKGSASFPSYESKFEVKFEKKHFGSLYQFRQGRNMSTTSIESVDSEDLITRSDDTIFETQGKEDKFPIAPESMEKCSISSDTCRNT